MDTKLVQKVSPIFNHIEGKLKNDTAQFLGTKYFPIEKRVLVIPNNFKCILPGIKGSQMSSKVKKAQPPLSVCTCPGAGSVLLGPPDLPQCVAKVTSSLTKPPRNAVLAVEAETVKSRTSTDNTTDRVAR